MTNTIRCVILDDELLAISYLRLLCGEMEEVEVIKVFNSPTQFLREIDGISCDLCILDIEMPGISGLDVARRITGKQIIFTTAYKEYAAEAFDLNVVDYVRKPIKKERLLQAFNKARELRAPARRHTIEWNTSRGKSRILTGEIAYIVTSEIDSRDKELVLNDGSVIILKNINFKTLLEMIPEQQFAQINKKEIIALRTITVCSSGSVTTSLQGADGHFLKFQLSEVYRDGLLKKLSN